jgi:hypothetical protein
MRMHDPATGVRRFLPELEFSSWLEIEISPGSVQLANARWAFLDKNFYRLCIAQCGARSERIYPVKLGRISGAQSCRNSTLGICRRAVEKRPFREDDDLSFRRCAPCGVQTRHAAANN